MRAARADDHWRRAFRREYRVQCSKLVYSNLLGLGTGSIGFSGAITAVVGANGVGKSTIVAALAELLGGQVALDDLDHSLRLAGSVVSADVVAGDTKYSPKVVTEAGSRHSTTGPPEEIVFVWLDPAYRSAQIRRQINRDAEFQDVLEGIAPRVLSADELDVVKYVIGKEYDECKIFEVPEYGGFDVLPYFRFTVDGVTYGSETMGQGELSLMLVLWVLLSLPSNAIVLLEEPETHVSPRSQQHMMNVLAQAASERGAWVIVTTHSPTVISRVPTKHIRLMTRVDDRIEVIENPAQYQLAQILVGAHDFSGLVLVEDAAAKEFAISLLDELDPDLLRQYEVAVAGSVANLTAALASMPMTRSWFTMMGAYDGDQRDALGKQNLAWPHSFLPGKEAPDVILKSAAVKAGAAGIASILARGPAQVAPALEAVKGLDPHDCLRALGENLGIGFSGVVRVLVRLWLQQDGSRQMCDEFLNALRSAPERAHAA